MVSPVRGDYRRRQAEIPLIVLCRFPGPALSVAGTAFSISISLLIAAIESPTFSTIRRRPTPETPSRFFRMRTCRASVKLN
jgi:hypothetical protein